MWDLGRGGKEEPWRADDYLFGVWNLLTGKETEGYARLEECVRHNSDYMEDRLKEFPEACNDPRKSMGCNQSVRSNERVEECLDEAM